MSSPEDHLLPAVAEALAGNLGASLQEIAEAAGVGRTTLHRHFPTRQALTDAVAVYAIEECNRIMDTCGFDDLPAPEVFERLSHDILSLAVAFELIYARPPITERTTTLYSESAEQHERMERFAARAQTEGYLRNDVPTAWIVYSLGSQALSVWHAVHWEAIARRDAPRLFRTTVMDGLSNQPRPEARA